MKIMIEAQPIVKTRSGVGWYAYNIINELLNREEEDLKLVGSSFDFLGRNNAENILKDIGFNNVEVFKGFPHSIYRLMWNVLPIIYNNLFSKNDIYHFFNYTFPPNIKGKVITTVYDTVYKLYPETMRSRNLYFLNREIERSVERADIVITISESAKKDIIEQLGVKEEKIRIVYPAIDQKIYRLFSYYCKDKGKSLIINKIDEETMVKKKLHIKEKYGLPKRYILYLGTIEPRKNIKSIIKAYSLFDKDIKKDIKLVIAGGKGWKCEEILDLPAKLNIEKDVVYTGYVDEVDKPFIYNMAEVFVFPSIYEGFGMPVLEALASGVPVITSDCSSLPEASGDAALYVEPNDYSSIYSKINSILSNERFKRDMIKKGFIYAEKFSWKKSAEEVMDIYKQLLNHC